MPSDVTNSPSPQSPVAAGGGRLLWENLPPSVREEIEAIAGAPVASAAAVSTGFSPGLASILNLANGQRIFVKAASAKDEPVTAGLHQAEEWIVSRLPSEVPAPRFLWGHGDGDWAVVAFAAIDGRPPTTPWVPDELDRVLDALTSLAAVPGARQLELPPTGPDLARTCAGWQGLTDRPDPELGDLVPWAADRLDALVEWERHVLVACEGESIVHGDLRADNVVLTDDSVYLVDWPYATRGAPWLDLAGMLPSVVMQGVAGATTPVTPATDAAARAQGGAWAAATFDAHPLGTSVHPGDLRAVVAGLAGYFLDSARRAPLATIPNLRPFQRAQGVAAVAWLEHLGI